MTPEEYIKAYTRGCSNELVSVEDRYGKKVISYHEWLTPENALAAVELAREEMMKNAVEGQVERGYCEDGISEHFEVFAYLSSRDERFRDLSDGQSVKVIIIKE